MDNIKNFLEKLKPGFKLTDKCTFLKKYDNDNNSIFDAEEVNQIKKDLTAAANSDGNPEQLSDNEILSFLKKLFNEKTVTDYDKLLAGVKAWMDSLIPYKEKILQKVKQFDTYKNLSDAKKQYIDVLVSIQENPDINDVQDITIVLSKDENKGGYSDEDVLSNIDVLNEFAKLEDFEFSSQNIFNILQIKQLPKDRIDRVNKSFQYISSEDTVKLSMLDDKVFSRIEESIANTPRMLELDDAIDFFESLRDDEYEKAKPLLYIQNRNKQLKLDQVSEILRSDNAKYSKALIIAENNNLNGNQILTLISFDDEKYSQALDLLELSKKRTEEINGFDIIELAQSDSKNFEKVKKLVLTRVNITPNIEIYLTGREITALSELDDDNLSYALELFNIEGRTTDELLSGEAIARLVELDKNILNQFIKDNPNFIVRNFSSRSDNITLEPERGSNKQFIFNKNFGLVETSLKSEIKYDDNGEEISFIKKINNIANRITQESYYEKPKDYSAPVLVKDIIKKFDKDRNVISVTNIDKSVVSGAFNITITDSNGNTVPVQYAYKNDEGDIIVYKNIISPDGSKIEYNYKGKQDDSYVSSYVIRDKNENVLFERNQFYEVLSKDPYNSISSVNGFEYEVVFDGKKIFVTNMSNNNQEMIDLSKVIEKDGEEIILELLKKMPPQQLLMMKKTPILKMEYEDNNPLLQENANWQSVSRHLTIGEHAYIDEDMEVLYMPFMHEYGHYLDTNIKSNELNNISDNQETNEIFKQELESFFKDTSVTQQNMISYFTDYVSADDERVAETNTIINNGVFDDAYAQRQYYFQKYFPKTIAKIAQLIAEMENASIKPKD